MRSPSDIGEAVAKYDYRHNPSPLAKGAIPAPTAAQVALWTKGCSHGDASCAHNGPVTSPSTRGASAVRGVPNDRTLARQRKKRPDVKTIKGAEYSWQSIEIAR